MASRGGRPPALSRAQSVKRARASLQEKWSTKKGGFVEPRVCRSCTSWHESAASLRPKTNRNSSRTCCRSQGLAATCVPAVERVRVQRQAACWQLPPSSGLKHRRLQSRRGGPPAAPPTCAEIQGMRGDASGPGEAGSRRGRGPSEPRRPRRTQASVTAPRRAALGATAGRKERRPAAVSSSPCRAPPPGARPQITPRGSRPGRRRRWRRARRRGGPGSTRPPGIRGAGGPQTRPAASAEGPRSSSSRCLRRWRP